MSRTKVPGEARKLAEYVRGLTDFVVYPRCGPSYSHMGAAICDAILQAGLNYRTVVLPRVTRILSTWPHASKTTRFLDLLRRLGAAHVVNWRHEEKPRRIVAMTEAIAGAGVETVEDLAVWMSTESNSDALRRIRGVGPKTVDYLRGLVGLRAVAVDRHVRTFAVSAGVRLSGYEELRDAVSAAATMLGFEPDELDFAIWNYLSPSAGRPAIVAA